MAFILHADLRDLYTALATIAGSTSALSAHSIVREPGELGDEALLIKSGLVCQYRWTGDREPAPTALRFQGEIIWPHERLAGFGTRTLSSSQILALRGPTVRTLLDQRPRLLQAYQRSIARSERIAYEWIVRDRRDSLGRTAHLICEIADRMGMVPDQPICLPFPQRIVGAITGQSAIHANRVLKQLAESGLISRSTGAFRADWEKLRQTGRYSSAYLA